MNVHTGDGPGNVASPHCPVVAFGVSRTSVARSGRSAGVAGQLPFTPFSVNRMPPGVERDSVSFTLTIPEPVRLR
jgi:hypothetical protein